MSLLNKKVLVDHGGIEYTCEVINELHGTAEYADKSNYLCECKVIDSDMVFMRRVRDLERYLKTGKAAK